MDEMGGHLHALAACLQVEVFAFQVTQQFGIVGQEEVGIIGDGTGCQAQGLDMFDIHEAVDGAGHVGPVHKRIPAGNYDFLDGG
jgi:hypothetical protein